MTMLVGHFDADEGCAFFGQARVLRLDGLVAEEGAGGMPKPQPQRDAGGPLSTTWRILSARIRRHDAAESLWGERSGYRGTTTGQAPFESANLAARCGCLLIHRIEIDVTPSLIHANGTRMPAITRRAMAGLIDAGPMTTTTSFR